MKHIKPYALGMIAALVFAGCGGSPFAPKVEVGSEPSEVVAQAGCGFGPNTTRLRRTTKQSLAAAAPKGFPHIVFAVNR